MKRTGSDPDAPPGRLEILLENRNRYPEPADPGLRPWLERLVASLAPAADSLAVRFTGERAMRSLNRRFRGHDRSTDVLSFPGGDTEEGLHLGDIAISVPTARRQAAARGEEVGRELKRLLLHGLLHCLGYDHESDGGEMRRQEKRLRRRWVDGDE